MQILEGFYIVWTLQSSKTTVADVINQVIVSVHSTYLSQLLPFPGSPEPSLQGLVLGAAREEREGAVAPGGVGYGCKCVVQDKKESR